MRRSVLEKLQPRSLSYCTLRFKFTATYNLIAKVLSSPKQTHTQRDAGTMDVRICLKDAFHTCADGIP